MATAHRGRPRLVRARPPGEGRDLAPTYVFAVRSINHIDRAARAAWPLFWPDATGKLRARATNPRMCSCCFVMQCMVCPWLYRCDRWMPPPDGNRLPAGRDPLNSQRFSSTTSQNEFKNAMPFLTFFFCKQSRHICVTHAHARELNYNNLILS